MVLRYTDDNDARFRTKRKFGRANQVPDVLDENQFHFREIDLAQTFADEVGVEMTTVDRRDLHDRHICFAIASASLLVVASPLKTATPSLSFNFSTNLVISVVFRNDRAHEIDRSRAVFIEQCAIFFRELCVRFEQTVLELDVVDFVGLCFECDHFVRWSWTDRCAVRILRRAQRSRPTRLRLATCLVGETGKGGGVCFFCNILPLPRYMWTPHGRHGSKLRTARMMSMPLNLSGPFSSKIGVFCTASS